MSGRVRFLPIAVAVVVAAFAAGYWIGGANSKGYAIYTGDCYAGMTGASCTGGEIGFGVPNGVAWTDANGVGRGGADDPGEWPSCLPPLTETKGVRFAAAWLPIGDAAWAATIVWVDCRGR